MKRSSIWFALSVILLLIAVVTMAQGGPGPSRRGPVGHPGTGCMACQGLDLSSVETLTGIAVAIEGGPGEGVPTLILRVGGEELEIVIGPYRVWAASDIEVTPGEELTVTFVPCTNDGHLVALSVIEEETGKTVQLRDPETGLPLSYGRRGRR